MYTLRFNLGNMILHQLWQMLSHLMLYLIILLTDVIVKVTVADLITTFILADVIAIIMWDDVITHLLMK